MSERQKAIVSSCEAIKNIIENVEVETTQEWETLVDIESMIHVIHRMTYNLKYKTK